MRKAHFIIALYSFVLLSSGYGVGEKTIIFGSASSWEAVENLQGIAEVSRIRPHPVLVLASMGDTQNEALVDLCLSFNEGRPERFADSRGRYNVSVSPGLGAVDAPWSRTGTGAALFNGSGNIEERPLVLTPRANALFAPGSHIRDFSIEFWIYPQNMENGGQILSWTASMPDGRGGYIGQRIEAITSRNRIQWTFRDFFFSPGSSGRSDSQRISLTLSGPPVLPRTWSHHLIRFDADLGLLEYLVDGKLEALDYASSSGREGGEVYTPVIGGDSRLVLGVNFSGMMDEFRIYGRCLEIPSLAKYPSGGGRLESRTLDLGHANSRLLKIDTFGGRTSTVAGRSQNEYSGSGRLDFPDHAQIKFFARAGSSPFQWNDIPWVPVNPGEQLPQALYGRFVQIAADFYPSGDGGTSPYLSEIRLTYRPAEPPPPPTQLVAVAKDGAVELSWRPSPSRELGGYLVYFGTARGEYFGNSAMPGNIQTSPVNAGNRTSVRIEGLSNGTLYYFAVAAYNQPLNEGTAHVLLEPGEFSREAAARPLRMAE